MQALELLSFQTVGDSLFLISIYLSLKLSLCIIALHEKGDCILQPNVTILLHKLCRGEKKKKTKMRNIVKTRKNKEKYESSSINS